MWKEGLWPEVELAFENNSCSKNAVSLQAFQIQTPSLIANTHIYDKATCLLATEEVTELLSSFLPTTPHSSPFEDTCLPAEAERHTGCLSRSCMHCELSGQWMSASHQAPLVVAHPHPFCSPLNHSALCPLFPPSAERMLCWKKTLNC